MHSDQHRKRGHGGVSCRTARAYPCPIVDNWDDRSRVSRRVRPPNEFQSQTKRADCHELNGLIVLPNGYEHQRRLLHGLEPKLRLGSERLTWTDVSQKNCNVRVTKRGNPEVKRFQRCFYCQKLELS